MSAPSKLAELVEQYASKRDEYRRPPYNETQARIELIDRLFELLGWDIKNERGFSDAYKDVVHEDRVRVEGKAKAPDYAFRIGGVRKFLLEAKKPSLNLSQDTSAALQVRRYAWSANLSLCVLTNFEELIIYDATVRPTGSDTARKARAKIFKYTEYESRWTELVDLLSPGGIQKGNFDKFVSGAAARRGTSTVDNQFLQEIEGWRSALANDIAGKNVSLSVRDLNFCVQTIIDRIVFLRIAEDRGVETYGRLREAAKKSKVYTQLVELFRAADRRYNSGLFHLIRTDAADELVDEMTPGISISDSVLAPIINGLYYPESPYEFSVLPADILGQVYERFLGKVITLDGRNATIEVKPEVKKSGGVYYTPSYIVNYIVNGTIGVDLQNSTLSDVAGGTKGVAPYRAVDPACGSGSFLIEVYQHLLDWYLGKYTQNTKKYSIGKSAVIHNTATGWKLRIAERKRILLDHIYGVDIDPQAVEVTKLSLLLKVLEGESSDDIAKQMDLFKDRVLPDLGRNIKCGNSLINSSYANMFPNDLLNEETKFVVNAFDWNLEFEDVFASGGFDAVVGNPPYFSIDKTWGAGDHRLDAMKSIYPHIHTDKTDIYYYFIAKAMEITQGSVGFIVSRAFIEAVKAEKLRGYITQNGAVKEVFDFQNFAVFDGVGITTAIMILSKHDRPKKTQVIKALGNIDPTDRNAMFLAESKELQRFTVPRKSLTAEPWRFSTGDISSFFERVDRAGDQLSTVLTLGQGMQTGANKVFGKISAPEIKAMGATKKMVRRRVRNTDVQRYHFRKGDEFLLYLEDEVNFGGLPKGVQNYLTKNRAALSKRAAFKRGNCDWWRYTWPLQKDKYTRKRIVCPYLAKENRFAIDDQFQVLGLTDTTVIFDGEQREDIRYICALLNSRLLSVRFRGIGKLKSGGIREYFDSSVGKLPIRRIDWNEKVDVASHKGVVDAYDELSTLYEKLDAPLTSSVARDLRKSVVEAEQSLEKLICSLYGITLEELDAADKATA